MTDQQVLVQKLWKYCNVLRDDGLSYGDYIEQLTYLLFVNADRKGERAPVENGSTLSLKLLGDLSLVHRLAV